MHNLKIDDLQHFSKQQMEAATSFASTLTKGLQEIAAESAEYSKHSLSAGAAVVEKLVGAKSLESAMQIQSDYAKAALEGFVARSTKINEIMTRLAGEAFKIERTAVAKV